MERESLLYWNELISDMNSLNNSNRNRNVYSEIVEQCKKEKKNR